MELPLEKASDARSLETLTGMLGWNSVAVFTAGEHVEKDILHVNQTSVVVVMADPWPEYKMFTFQGGEHVRTMDLLSMSYEQEFENLLESHGHAQVFPMQAVSFIERGDNMIPVYVEPEENDDLLRGKPGQKYAVKAEFRDKSTLGIADEEGVIRTENGEAFSKGPYRILDELPEEQTDE